jgi:peptidoglycan/xylan/chitin deacetylase (PgdA/CDA1 family)
MCAIKNGFLRYSGGTLPRTDGTPVLMYHAVDSTRSSRAFKRFVVPLGLFDEHLSALGEAGYRTGTVSELGQSLRSPEPPSRRPVLYLTFDDGYSTFVNETVPVLERHKARSTVYVPTAFAGGRASWLEPMDESSRTILDWDDARSLARLGIEIGSHGHHHLDLDILSSADLETELTRSREKAEDELGQEVTSIAYPFGYHNRKVREVSEAVGFRTGCEVGYGLHHDHRGPFQIRRLLIGPTVSPEGLVRLIETAAVGPVQRVRRMSRPVWRELRRRRVRPSEVGQW